MKTHKFADNATTVKAWEKIITNLKSSEFNKKMIYNWLNLEKMKFYLIKLATDS
jgi:hypothetical protein